MVHVDQVDMIPEALELAKMGVLPEGMYRNRTFAQSSLGPAVGQHPVRVDKSGYRQTVLGLIVKDAPAL